MPNRALRVNAPVFRDADLEITTRGSDWYFTVCAVMTVSTLTVMALSFTKPRTHRLFHYISAGLLLVASIAYFSMGSGLGQVPIQAEFVRRGSSQVFAAGTREIFYVRYIDWFVTTPLLLMDLLLTAGLPWPTILITILVDWVMIICGLVGALIQTRYKWGYYTFGMVSFFYVIYVLLVDARLHARALGGSIKRTYYSCGVLLIFVWFLYPIAWGVSEGGNVIHPDSEAIFYGILDLIAKPVFTAVLLWGHRTIDPADLGMAIRSPAPVSESEKHHNGAQGHTTGRDGVQNGVSTGVSSGVQPTAANTTAHGATGATDVQAPAPAVTQEYS